MRYTKEYSSPSKLVLLLQSRGLGCSDVVRAEEQLRAIGYYRLSGYLYPLLRTPKEQHIYKAGSTIEQAISLYDFDREFRLFVFKQIERIEVAVRSAIVNITCAETNDVFWISKREYFLNEDKFCRTMALIDKELTTSREDFITHFKNAYTDPYPPSWMIAEILPLGVLTRIYDNIANNRIRKRIARNFGLNTPVFISWMTIVTLTRNTCCHHARLWNRNLSLRALNMNRFEYPWVSGAVNQGRVFYTLCILKHFVDRIQRTNTFKQDLLALLADHPNIDISAMGFPDDWQSEELWRN